MVDPDDEDQVEIASEYTVIAKDFAPGDSAYFALPEGTVFALRGTTADDQVLDIAFDFQTDGGSQRELVAEADIDLVANVLQISDGGASEVLGTARIQQATMEEVSSEATQPIAGTTSDDRFTGRVVDDDIDGLAGQDTIVYAATRSGVDEAVRADGAVNVTLLDSGTRDTLVSVERVELFDGVYLYDLPDTGVPFTTGSIRPPLPARRTKGDCGSGPTPGLRASGTGRCRRPSSAV